MKKIIFGFILIIVLLQSCSTRIQYVQIWKTEPVNSSKYGDFYIYENDTIKIVYFFWSENGTMAFSIYNKSNKPVYIDWKKSTFITNGSKFDYWVDKTTVKSAFGISSSSYNNIITNLSSLSSSNIDEHLNTNYDGSIDSKSQTNGIKIGKIESNRTSNTNTQGWSHITVSKQERITFLPPKTYIDKATYNIANNYFSDWKTGFTKITEVLTNNPKETTVIYSKSFSNSNTPLDFRNFLTLSFKEDFSTEFYVDNEFYVKEVTAMNRRQFYLYKTDKTNNTVSEEILPKYKKGVNFFVKGY